MKNVMMVVAALMLIVVLVCATECTKPDEPNNETLLPQVKTTEVMDISTTSAICGGEIISNGDGTIIECGVCWSTKAEPSINDNYVIAQTTTGSFTILLDSLSSNTTYTVRAYAKNEAGIGYGNQVSFTTLSNSGGVNTPIGAIGGIYRIGDTDRVYFSQGNLQYQASTNTWRFAENQWDFVGEGLEFGNVFENGVKCDNELIAPDYNGWIDLFGWGTSGYDHGAVCYQPWSTDTGSGYYNAYGQSSYNLYDQTGQADWGYNAISNGGNQENMWRTLTREEWYYVFYLRNTSSGIRWARATVNGVNGIIILPDNWTSIYPIYDGNGNGGGYDSNIISATSWTNILEANGAVFLPVTRIRYETDVYTDYGDYWSASHYDTSFAYDVCFNDSLVDPMMYEGLLFYFRCNGYGVRLVCPAE